MGVIFSMQSLSMTFMGENDLRGYRMVISRSLLIVVSCMAIISLAMGLFPDLLLSCFGADARLIDFARRPIVILSTSLLPFTLLFYYCSVYVTLNRVRLSMSVILSEPLFILAALWVMEHFFPGQFWWFFTLTWLTTFSTLSSGLTLATRLTLLTTPAALLTTLTLTSCVIKRVLFN